MYRLYVLVTVLVTTWNKDECVALTVAQRTREQIKLARAAIRRSDMAPSYLRIANFGHPKGRGIVAGKDFDVGDFITYLHGRICSEEPITDKYTFDVTYRHHAAWIDASREDGSYGRLINDEWRNPNSEARLLFTDGRPHIGFIALKLIKKGHEINFNHNYEGHFQWRQSTREQIKLARAAIRRSDMAPSYLRIANFGHPKGRGIIAGKDFDVGDFITYYYGKYCVDEPLSNKYTFDVTYSSLAAWIDASQEDGSYGRLINDEWRNPNTEARLIFTDGRAHIGFFALKLIKKGHEINFNYDYEGHFQWRQASQIHVLTKPHCNRTSWEDVFLQPHMSFSSG